MAWLGYGVPVFGEDFNMKCYRFRNKPFGFGPCFADRYTAGQIEHVCAIARIALLEHNCVLLYFLHSDMPHA